MRPINISIIATFAALISCSSSEEQERPEFPRELVGDKWVTGKGVTFYWVVGFSEISDPVKAAIMIDQAFDEWVSIKMNDGWQKVVLENRARKLPIQLMPWLTVYAGRALGHVAGYHWPEKQIGIAMGGTLTDKLFGKSHGIRILLHEWEHELRGAWH